MTGLTRRSTRPWLIAIAGSSAVALSLTACGPANQGGGGGGGAGGAAGSVEETPNFTYLNTVEDAPTADAIKELAAGACAEPNKAMPYKLETVPQANLDQKLQLLAGQNALPNMFAAGGAPSLTQSLDKNGQLVDLEKAFTEQGVMEQVEPAAVSTIKSLYGGKLNVFPYQYNIEGFWYNTQVFEDNGIAVPQTWDEMVAAADKLQKAGLIPFSTGVAGQGWPITRLISAYLQRDVGPNALADVRDKKAKLTDPKYVKAAQAVADLGAKGYLGKAPEATDYDTINSQFLTGKAGMIYMGSWILTNFADKKQNKIGNENIGFFPIPTVAGGTGTTDQTVANVGLPTGLSAKLYGDKTAAWVKCIGQNYGKVSLEKEGRISGFKAPADVKVDAMTKLVQEQIKSTKTGLVWFEAYLSSKASTTSWNNIGSMVNGKITAEKFMQLVQADVDAT
ncbi:MAG TPA: extracellular solute-binding protein [Propionibacteriaceae bacterium]